MSPRPIPSLISPSAAASWLGIPGVKFVDVRFALPTERPPAQERFDVAHIPGAIFFDVEKIADPDNSLPHMLPGAEAFQAHLQGLGIDRDDMLILYDDGPLRSAARAWWMLRAFGHRNVAILDGGFNNWCSTELPRENGKSGPTERGDLEADLDRAFVWNREMMLENLSVPTAQVIDARSVGRFAGTEPDPWPGRRAGHVPGSLNLPFDRLSDPATGLLKNSEEIKRLFEGAGLDFDRPAVATCGSGVTACVLAFALHLLGKDDVAVYDGSWAEWGLEGDTPVEAAG